jgi:cytochrome c peroxidase
MTWKTFAMLAVAATACGQHDDAPDPQPTTQAPAAAGEAASEDLNPRLLRRFKSLPPATPGDKPAVVDLGRILYYDPRLSVTGEVSCNSCHPLTTYGVTDQVVSIGVDGKKGRRNAPTTYHAAGHFRQFWDGRATTIDQQAQGPLLNPSEMGMTAEGVVAALSAIPGYRELFFTAFSGSNPITIEHVATAIAEFERGLVTPARWDRYLDGDKTALSSREKEGAKLFANLGCMVCHTGAYLGGTMFEKVGARVPWPNQNDRGREEVTGDEEDAMMFKVPTLRNVAKTAPYFHDGSAATLHEAVRMMAHHQLDEELSDDEIDAIVSWLGALTGDLPAAYIAVPKLPGDAGGS